MSSMILEFKYVAYSGGSAASNHDARFQLNGRLDGRGILRPVVEKSDRVGRARNGAGGKVRRG